MSLAPRPTTEEQQNGHVVAATTLSLADVCHNLRRKVADFLESPDVKLCSTQTQARASMAIVKDALDRYKPEQLSLSYNGGKDCLVLLILILACMPDDYGATTLQAIYIAPEDPFPEVDDFVTRSSNDYCLDLTRYRLPMKQALEEYKAEKPSVEAVFMGTRRTDPFSEFLTSFAPTDGTWPRFMRVNPILDWHYADIWTFLLGLDVPFCSLYSRGYSSLGGVKNTRPNPALAIDADGTRFRPAHELKRDDEERLGRDR